MSQHDMILDNADGATFRADANAAVQALASSSKGNSAPSTPYAGQLWLDDNTPSSTVWTLNRYDGTDWIVEGYLDTTNNLFIPAGIGAGTNTIASASTVDLGSVPQTSITVSGTTTITSFGTSMLPGQAKIVTFSGALTLTHNGSSLILPGGANITTAAGDQAIVHCLSSGNYRVMYQKATGAAVSGGKLIQSVNTQTGTGSTGTTQIPSDNTIPQNTEGDEYMTLAITPTSASNKLKIEVVYNGTHSAISRNTVALFQDSTAGALAVGQFVNPAAGYEGQCIFTHYMTAGTTSSTTFKVRAGGNAAGTTTFNGTGGVQRYGGVYASSITITEIQV